MGDRSDVRELAERLDRLESREAIRQLAAEYARLIDSKNLEALAGLFTEDTPVGAGSGRGAKLEALIRNHGGPGKFGTTIHLISGHSILLDRIDADYATGVLYCRAEHEIGDRWVIATIQYWDEYSRRAGQWLFHRRDIRAYYVVDVLERPDTDARDTIAHLVRGAREGRAARCVAELDHLLGEAGPRPASPVWAAAVIRQVGESTPARNCRGRVCGVTRSTPSFDIFGSPYAQGRHPQ